MKHELPRKYLDYIAKQCKDVLLPEEVIALRRFSWNQEPIQELGLAQTKQERLLGFTDPKVNEIVALGEETAIAIISGRVIKEHGESILNFCPKCDKLARTPKAKQCRYCKHDWH